MRSLSAGLIACLLATAAIAQTDIPGSNPGTSSGGGGSGNPGGSNGQVQYRVDSTTFGGIAGATTDGTITTFASGDLLATSPVFTTPALGASTGSSLALNSISLGTNIFAAQQLTSITSGTSDNTFLYLLATPASGSTATYNGEYVHAILNSTFDTTHSLTGIEGDAEDFSSGAANQAQGVYGIARSTAVGATYNATASLYGGRFQAQVNGASTYNHALGVKIEGPVIVTGATVGLANDLYLQDVNVNIVGAATAADAIHFEGAGINNAIGWSGNGGSSINADFYSSAAGALVLDASAGLTINSAVKETSLALGGCTIGSSALCATGSGNFSAGLTASNLNFSGNFSMASSTTNGALFGGAAATITDSTGTGTISIEAIAAVPADTLAATNAGVTVTSLAELYLPLPIAGTNVTATSKFSLLAAGQIKGLAGALFLGGTTQINHASNFATQICDSTCNGAVTIGGGSNTLILGSSAGGITFPNITADTAHTDASVCEDTTTHAIFSGAGTLGVCLGTSTRAAKTEIVPVTDGLSQILALVPDNYFYRKGFGDNGAREQYGFMAEDVVKVLPKLVTRDKKGKPQSVDILGMVPVLVKSIQQLEAENASLRARVSKLEHHTH